MGRPELKKIAQVNSLNGQNVILLRKNDKVVRKAMGME